MTETTKDFTGHTGPFEGTYEYLYGDNKRFPIPWRMYSFSRPATHFWNGVANYLHDQGMTEKQIGEKLMSKDMRWLLDHGPICDTHLDKLGYEAAAAYYKGEKPT